MLIIHCGYDIMDVPLISRYTELQSFVTELQLRMFVSLEHYFCPVTYRHVIGVSPDMSSETSHIEYHIIDGAYLECKAIYSSQEILIGVVGTGSPLQRSHIVLFLFHGGTESLKCSKTNQDII